MSEMGVSSAISRLRRVPLREVWRHDAYDFTTWLERNTDVLGDALGIVIANVERERAAGSFSVDLVGEDAAGNAIVIENQLERSDHDHLGKLITYLARRTPRSGSSAIPVRSTSARSPGSTSP